ncbi:MAG: glycoside hydrolase family 2 TIM barrel-domain containing protein, partial [Eubacteriales bacterium]|nr:glycoside hydrolase family 2 TIM barrel-domain containing protein [Eubacteriales bacterium]
QLTLENARLWSPDAPQLYTLHAEALAGGERCDGHAIPFGVRTFSFDGDKGFFLNGVGTKLKGVCVHHDAGALGAAVPKEVWRRRLKAFKEMGCNALRTAHNPPDTHLLDLCDEMGFLVMDEAFDEWEGAKNKWWQGHNVYPPKRFGYAEDFPQWYRADLEGMVRRDRNHPSIVIWSIGNEIDYPNDPYVTPLFDEVLGNNDANKPAAERRYDPRKPDAGRLAVVAKELTQIVHDLDPTRPVTSALSFPELSNRTGYADVLDIVGYNYKEKFYDEDHEKYPGRVIYGSENGKDARAWHAVRDREFICGQFLWTGIDFLGECRGWPVRISQAGLVDLAGFAKPGFWQRKAMWTDGAPFVKIAVGHADDKWDGPDAERFVWQAEEGRMMRVSCYTNAPQAELLLNGDSLGKKQIADEDGYRACWQVPYQAGELRAVVDGAQDALATAGPAAQIVLRADRECLPADGRSIAHVELELLDGEGRRTAQEQEVFFRILGDGEILGLENGRPDDLTPYAQRSRETFGGRLLAYVRAGRMAGKLQLHAFTRAGLYAMCEIEQR